MEAIVNYDPAYVAGKSSVTALSVTEATLVTITDHKFTKASQVSVYGSVTLGAVTSATFKYYYSQDGGTTWYPVSLYNTTSGEITQRNVVVDSGTYSTSGASMFVDNVPMAACTAFKVTALSASGTPALNDLTVMVRNN